MAIDCVAIGDSIAVGISSALQCTETRAQIGLPSSRIIDIAPGKWHKFCIISAGSNDPLDVNGIPVYLKNNLDHIRNQTQCQFYVWLEPVNQIAAGIVYDEAIRKHHDIALSFTPGSDNVHPASYNTLAGQILQATGN